MEWTDKRIDSMVASQAQRMDRFEIRMDRLEARMDEGFKEGRKELHDSIQGLRQETQAGFADLRTEMNARFDRLWLGLVGVVLSVVLTKVL
jgi:hypothetical protein